jgi:hypothetical protein
MKKETHYLNKDNLKKHFRSIFKRKSKNKQNRKSGLFAFANQIRDDDEKGRRRLITTEKQNFILK